MKLRVKLLKFRRGRGQVCGAVCGALCHLLGLVLLPRRPFTALPRDPWLLCTPRRILPRPPHPPPPRRRQPRPAHLRPPPHPRRPAPLQGAEYSIQKQKWTGVPDPEVSSEKEAGLGLRGRVGEGGGGRLVLSRG